MDTAIPAEMVVVDMKERLGHSPEPLWLPFFT
jgi:hypothetical protein